MSFAPRLASDLRLLMKWCSEPSGTPSRRRPAHEDGEKQEGQGPDQVAIEGAGGERGGQRHERIGFEKPADGHGMRTSSAADRMAPGNSVRMSRKTKSAKKTICDARRRRLRSRSHDGAMIPQASLETSAGRTTGAAGQGFHASSTLRPVLTTRRPPGRPAGCSRHRPCDPRGTDPRDRAEKEALLPRAELLVVRFVGQVDDLVGLQERAGGVERAVVQPERLRLGVASRCRKISSRRRPASRRC